MQITNVLKMADEQYKAAVGLFVERARAECDIVMKMRAGMDQSMQRLRRYLSLEEKYSVDECLRDLHEFVKLFRVSDDCVVGLENVHSLQRARDENRQRAEALERQRQQAAKQAAKKQSLSHQRTPLIQIAKAKGG